ncbi:phosphate propanoyltransferase [Anaerosalibacter bizertensis]|uniref:Phosphate propanoyltransferase n=1 Tax=Anaerosalibacter bizertensis TaxID=932217 RepID=A0A844FH42_9FIRM|nr:phosphate propanoyltransferase [Anaerosalibacter bizertensis]MBV1819129.1 phosphate propanoyltransferase [Bacteroidales bacterium MSK.15.36]HHV26021.1 phosphate propanoyltransferase [Tissierellia bacterium]MCB5559738.1 phosphate propanoyltransferase [Anaerosalibacter bizertensis]MCG4564711.1 phosphate propanoyltransferase [Anaerosalibacter bizertensis]MCG4582599.1 phosphate propanoyltransferase [Anaerosalibacter bizertensis]
MKTKLPIAMSNKHIHLSKEDLEVLFGEGYELTKKKDLVQPGQFAAEERVEIVGPKGSLKVRVLGPVRKNTQIEVSVTDAFSLGVESVIRNSGDIEGTPGLKVVGPKGEVELDKGVIVAARHIHMHTDEAKEYGVKDGDIVSVKIDGIRGLTFHNVLVRSGEGHKLEMHVDMEEGNAAGVKNGDLVEIIK